MNTLPAFPLVSSQAKQYSRLSVVLQPVKTMTPLDLRHIAHLIHAPVKALINTYEHYGEAKGDMPFNCTLMSKLKQPDVYGQYCVGISVLPTELLRYGRIKAEHVDELNEVTRRVAAGLNPNEKWHPHVKHAYRRMQTMVNKVDLVHDGIPCRTKMTFNDFPGLYLAIYESQVFTTVH
jgi:hypothetical protein